MHKSLQILRRQFSIIKKAKQAKTQIPFATPLDLQDINKSELPLVDIIKDEILDKGPITFSRYWDLALGHQEHGYYCKRDVFNTKGDFITSVEISQMFGEILGIWVINLLNQIKAINLEQAQGNSLSKQFSLLEFGPGKGTLMHDVINVLHQFNLLNGVEINFIEMSPFMRKMQQEKILGFLQSKGIYMKYENFNKVQESQEGESAETIQMQQGDGNKKMEPEIFSNEDSDNYIKVRWFSTFEDMLQQDFGTQQLQSNTPILPGNTIAPYAILAHEFFDALPTNIFQFEEGKGWREKMVNIAHNNNEGKMFEFINSDLETENVKKILNPQKTFSSEAQKDIQNGDIYEIQPQSALIASSISQLIHRCNGGALIIDYGENHGFSDSIRGIRKHKFIPQEDILEYPGEIDLSAYVNYQHLTSAANQTPDIVTGGPMPQGYFLESMGLNARLEALCKGANKQTAERLESEYFRIAAPEEMGQIYKCYYIGKEQNGEVFPFISDNERAAFY